MPSSRRALMLLMLPMLAVRAEAADSPPKTAPAGEPAGVATDALAAGATALQTGRAGRPSSTSTSSASTP